MKCYNLTDFSETNTFFWIGDYFLFLKIIYLLCLKVFEKNYSIYEDYYICKTLIQKENCNYKQKGRDNKFKI